MKAIRIHEDGGPEVLRYEEAPDPSPGPGEVLIGLRAASLNHLDIWLRRGLPSAPKPRILGADGAGVVVGLGEGVDRFAEGDEVVINPGLDEGATIVGEHMDGTHAELIALPADYVYPLPDGLSFEEAAAFPLVFETAYRMLVTRAGLQEGEWVFVWGIGGGVATASLQIAKALGARVIVTSSSDEKLERARELGADATVNHADGRRRRGGARGDRRPRRRHRRRARRRGDVEDLAPGRCAGRAGDRLRRDERPEPAGQPPPHLVEAAHRPRLDDGDAGGLPGASTTSSRAAAPSRSSTASSRSRRRRPRTSTWRPAASSARSSSKIGLAAGLEQDPPRDVVRAARRRRACVPRRGRPAPSSAPTASFGLKPSAMS